MSKGEEQRDNLEEFNTKYEAMIENIGRSTENLSAYINAIVASIGSIQARIEPYIASLSVVGECIAKFQERYSPLFENFGKQMLLIFEEIEKQDKAFKKNRYLYELLGREGWNISEEIDLTEHKRILTEIKALNKATSAINKYFMEMYSETYVENLIDPIIDGLVQSEIENRKKIKDYIEGSKVLIEMGNYNSCIAVLTPILEALLSTLLEDKTQIQSRIFKEKLADMEKDAFIYIKKDIVILESFMNIFFKKSDFSKKEPENVNRHWLLHGRSINDFNKVDCLKLLCMIRTALSVEAFANQE